MIIITLSFQLENSPESGRVFLAGACGVVFNSFCYFSPPDGAGRAFNAKFMLRRSYSCRPIQRRAHWPAKRLPAPLEIAHYLY